MKSHMKHSIYLTLRRFPDSAKLLGVLKPPPPWPKSIDMFKMCIPFPSKIVLVFLMEEGVQIDQTDFLTSVTTKLVFGSTGNFLNFPIH